MRPSARAALHVAVAALLLGCAVAEDFPLLDPPEDGRPDPRQQWPPDKPSVYQQHKPKARAGVMVARYVPHSKLPPGLVLPFANITYRIVGADMTMANYRAKQADFEKVFKKLYGGANLHAKILEVKASEGGAGTIERPCQRRDAECCLEKGALADPETWSALDVRVEVGCSRESLWPDQGSTDWAHSRIIGMLLAQHGFHDARCLLQRADVLKAGVHAHKYLPITALYTEETVLQFTGHSLARWLPVDTAVQNLILHSMDLMGLNRIAGCARIRITSVSQRCSWDPGRGQTGVANITFVTHREYAETTLPMAFAKSLHVLLERLNEEGLNIAKIEVVANRPVQGPEWGNMHDQIAAFLPANETVRTYETRVPVEQLPNYQPPQQLGSWSAAAAAATALALLAGLALLGRRRSGLPRLRTVPLASVGGFPDALDQMPRLRANLTAGLPSSQYSGVQRLLESSEAARNQGPAAFNELMARMHAALPNSQGADRPGPSTEEFPSVDLQATWPSLADSPNPFLADAALQLPSRVSGGSSGGSGGSARNFGTIPAATLQQLSGSHDAERTEAQRAEQSLRRQQLRERGVAFEQQLARADSVASWLLSDGEIEICLNESGKRWLLGSGSYGKVYRGVRGGVQDVAVKVLQTTDELQINQFCLEIKLLKSLSFDRNIVQFMGVCLHSGNPMLVLEFMEGGDLRQRLSAPDHQRYLWHNDGQQVALDVVRGLHFLHTNRVVHSDLKSRNVLLGRDGLTAKLSDVGMSRILSGSRSSLAHAGTGQGTWSYAAPELLMGEATTVKADIYSLGVLIWEICTHESPRRGLDRELDAPRECPLAIKLLVAECKQNNPQDRPTAREVFNRIRQAGSHVGMLPSLASSGELSQGARGPTVESPLPSRDRRQQQPAR